MQRVCGATDSESAQETDKRTEAEKARDAAEFLKEDPKIKKYKYSFISILFTIMTLLLLFLFYSCFKCFLFYLFANLCFFFG